MLNLNNKKILVINDHGPSYFTPFAFLGAEYTQDTSLLSSDPDSICLVVFTGGSDVNPELYGKSKHRYTSDNPSRDMEEVEFYSLALGYNIPMAGICRGAQFLCAMAGGTVVQDVTNHCRDHSILVNCPVSGEIKEIGVTSSHHQMQYPYDLPTDNYEVLGWGASPRSNHYGLDQETTVELQDASDNLKEEPDIVYYPVIKSLAVQFHPEWMDESSDGVKLFQSLVTKYLVPHMRDSQDDRAREEAIKTAG